jgi:hypothetical protein
MNAETIAKLKQEGIIVWFADANVNETPFEKATHWHICMFEPNYVSINGKLPKRKPFDTTFVYEQLAKKQKVESIDYYAIFKPVQIQNARFYATTYGLGVEVLFGNKEETISLIKKFLEDNGIDYSTEYSSAWWVYRFKISKAKANIDKLLALQS